MRFAFVGLILFAFACGDILESTVTVTRTGNGSGTITADDGQSCSETTCTMSFPQGSVVTLTATGSEGSEFTGWSGPCDHPGACKLKVGEDTSVGAEFELQQLALTVAKTGTGLARITSMPGGIDCGPTCTATFEYGTSVTLTVEASPGTNVVGWSGGDCSGTGPCTTTVSEAATITADLGCAAGSRMFSMTGAVEELMLPPCVSSITIDAYGAQGGSISSVMGGRGARAQGTFAVAGGTKLFVVVGNQGEGTNSPGASGGGGGGSFVFLNATTNTPLIAAGGGGGAALGSCTPGVGSATQTPTNSSGGAGNAAGGSAGNGGGGGTMTGTPGTPGTGGGGSGFRNAGANGTVASQGGGGQPPRTGGGGGAAGTNGAAGGFGGGGGSAGNAGAGGGGGGYAGGGGGNGWNNSAWGCGGGGGSYNAGTAQMNQPGVRMGAGQVIISW